MANSIELKISYDGEALRKHKMDVRDLAPALLAIGELFEESNRVLNDDKTTLRVKVNALETGSFGIVFELDQSLVDQITGFLTGDGVTSILNLKELIIGGALFGTASIKGLFSLIRWLKGGKPDQIKDLKNGYIQLTINNETITVPSKLLLLYKEVSVRKAVENTLAPLQRDGITEFSVIENGKVVENIPKSELRYFVTPAVADEKILEHENEAAYSIISLAFKEDNKWRLYDGSSTINVSVKDIDFLKKVELNQVSFTKGDILICKVKTIQWKTDHGLKTEYELLEVKEHQRAGRQLSIFDDLM